ncbi:MAG: STAS domain-containing protein [Sulfuriferula sp.]
MSLIHAVSGDLTLNTATKQLADGLDAIKQGCVEFDFAAVAKLDSTALAFILVCQRAASNSNYKLSCTHLPENLKNLAILYGVDPFLAI